MNDSVLLPILLFLPLLSAVVVALLPDDRSARHVAFAASLLTSLLGAAVAWQFFARGTGWLTFWDFDDAPGITDIGFHLRMGVDAIALFMVLLTSITIPMSILSSYTGIQDRPRMYYAWMLMMMFSTLGAFMSRDLLLFYILFELTLIPMFFLIGMWGGGDRRYAAAKFFLYTFAGSVFTLAAVIYLGTAAGTYRTADIIYFAQNEMSQTARLWCLLGLLVGFAIKAPLFPLHTWLPLAHTEAPTGGSVILAALLLKLGAYGILVIAIPIGLVIPGVADRAAFPTLLKILALFCCVGVIYGALAAWVQTDIKKIVAYSSVSHLGLCVLGSLALNTIGMSGSLLYMVNHGILTGALFLLVGMIYERFHTRDINSMSGLGKRMPVYSTFFVFFVLGSVGLPGLNGFVSEFLSVLGTFTSQALGTVIFGVVSASGLIFGAVYLLYLTGKIIFGPLKVPHVEHGESHGPALPVDLSAREIAVLLPFAAAVILLGVMPRLVLDPIQAPLELLRKPVPVLGPPTVSGISATEKLIDDAHTRTAAVKAARVATWN
jgi:NADH-quinone oxidoreductase subunit M